MNIFKKLLERLGLEKGFVDVAGGNLLATIMGGIFWLFLATLLTKEGYGQLNYFLSIAFIFGTLATLGQSITVTTFLAKGKEEARLQANSLVLLSNCVVFILLLIFINNLAVVILLIGISFFAVARAEHLGRRNYKRYSYIVIGQRLLNIPLSILLYFVMGIDGIIIGYGISTILFSYNYFRSLTRFRLRFGFIKKQLRFVMHSFSYDLSRTLVRNIDKLLIVPLFGFEILGLYQIGFQFLYFLAIIPISLFQFMLPQEAARIQMKKVAVKSLATAITFSISFYLLFPLIIPILFPNFVESILASQIMIFGSIPMTISAILYSKFFGQEKSKASLVAVFIHIASLLVLIYYLGTYFELIGLAIAILTALILECASLLIMSKIAHVEPGSNNNREDD